MNKKQLIVVIMGLLASTIGYSSALDTKFPKGDSKMKKEITEKYSLFYPGDINPHIIDLFHKAFQLVNTIDDIKHKKPTITFCRKNLFTVDLSAVDRLGEYWRDIIIYNLDKIEKKDDLDISVILLEELVHCYCDTLDEKVTGLIVTSLIPEIYFDTSTMQYKRKDK